MNKHEEVLVTQNIWLLDDVRPVDDAAERQIRRELPIDVDAALRGARKSPALAIRLHDIIIHDTKKWFGGADIRLDTFIVHGQGKREKPESFYMPGTFRFGGVKNGDHLPIDDTGLLVFYGKPLHFLDIFIMVSRDRKDTDDLALLLARQLQLDEFKTALSTLLSLAVAAPQAAVVTAAVGAAAILGNIAYQALQKATGNTIGLYRASWLQYRDSFGIGWHPETAVYRVKDLSFRYEILLDERASAGN